MGADARIAMAMLFSDREGMTDEEDQAFRTLGIAHILAVSGLHVGLLGGMLMALLDRLRMRRAWQLPIVAVFLLDYCALTGFTASSIRAAVMLLLVLIARTLGRKPDPLTTLAAAMLVVLALNPLQAYAAGFILSFASVAGITLLFPVFRDALERVLPQPEPVKYARRSRWRRFTDWLGRTLGRPAELIAISLSAQLGVLAPTAVFFNRLPLYGVFINLLVVPYTAILVAAFALALLLSPVPLLGMGMGWLAAVLGKGLLWAVELMSALPYASVRVPTVPAAISCALAACLIVFSRRVRLKPLKRLLCAALCAIIGIAGAYAARPAELRYIQLAVGQADAALVMDGDKTIAIDVGVDGAATLDYLLYEGRDVDALILTHLHYDHAGGVQALLENSVRIRHAYLPVNAEKQQIDAQTLAMVDLLREAGVPITELAQGDELRYNRAVIRALWPVRQSVRSGQDANELPLVLSVSLDGYTILCASDLTCDYEPYAAAPCDVLKVAHHGSNESTSADFLAYVQPELALISCSSGSRSLPGAELLERLREYGVPVARTDTAGDITIAVGDDRLCATPYKGRISE